MPDFFISYTAADEAWAEWIAWTLEAAGFETLIQKWDFPAGANFVLEMQKAAAGAKRTIAVLSADYLTKSRFGAPEWAAAFASDPDGAARTFVPVKVRPCDTPGLFKAIIHVDLVGLEEDAARQTLLDALTAGRRKPSKRPSFPAGGSGASATRAFPGAGSGARRAPYMPKLRPATTDLDKRRFIRAAFDLIRERFGSWLAELAESHPATAVDLVTVDASKFTAEVFVDGRSKGFCKIWIGGFPGGNNIAYAEGGLRSLGDNALNEALSISDDTDELALHAMMNMGIGNAAAGLDPNRLSMEDAAQYLWRRFCWMFER